jgi:hypothetical protein
MDGGWTGHAPHEHVFYELHVGTFTPQGTWEATAVHLPTLADLGMTTLELMPVAEFDGSVRLGVRRVDLFAPTRLYGCPDDMRASSISPMGWVWPSSSMSSTTTSAPQVTSSAVSPSTTSLIDTRTTGVKRSTLAGRTQSLSAHFSPQRRLLDPGVPPGWLALRRH